MRERACRAPQTAVSSRGRLLRFFGTKAEPPSEAAPQSTIVPRTCARRHGGSAEDIMSRQARLTTDCPILGNLLGLIVRVLGEQWALLFATHGPGVKGRGREVGSPHWRLGSTSYSPIVAPSQSAGSGIGRPTSAGISEHWRHIGGVGSGSPIQEVGAVWRGVALGSAEGNALCRLFCTTRSILSWCVVLVCMCVPLVRRHQLHWKYPLMDLRPVPIRDMSGLV